MSKKFIYFFAYAVILMAIFTAIIYYYLLQDMLTSTSMTVATIGLSISTLAAIGLLVVLAIKEIAKILVDIFLPE